jgi:peptide/nickel transport system permease protein
MADAAAGSSRSFGPVGSRRLPGLLAVCAFLGSIVVAYFLGPVLAPFSPTAFDPTVSLVGPDLSHWFGTDEFGRDVLSRIVHGARPTLTLALASAAMGVVLGAPTGMIAGYFGGKADEILMRGMDVLMSFPALVLAMLIVVMLGASQVNVVIAIGVVFWPRSARLVRSVALDLSRRDFVDSARARGESRVFILAREILPSLWNIIIVDFSLRVAAAILLTASLSYLGIGVSPPTPAWGLMVKDGQQFMQIAPWLVIFPCLAIAYVSIGTVLTGDWVRRTVAMSGSGASGWRE